MKSATYFNRKTFSRYDDKRVIAYLHEQVIESYTPEDAPEGFAPRTAYTYSGTEADGGTLIDAATDTRDKKFELGMHPRKRDKFIHIRFYFLNTSMHGGNGIGLSA